MARQNIARGAAANDGSGDSLRDAAQKINENFVELYLKLGGDSDIITSGITFETNNIVFEGSIVDDFETRLTTINPTADRTISLPDQSGTLVVNASPAITGAVLTNPQINDDDGTHQYIINSSSLSANRTITLPTLNTNDTFVFASNTQTLTNKTVSEPILIEPIIHRSLDDSSGAPILRFTSAASAVNHVRIQNAATGGAPTINVAGSGTNVNLNIAAKGTGAVRHTSKVAYASETITTSGTISLVVPLTIFNSTGAVAMTMANGTVVGESKKLVNINTGRADVTPNSFGQGTSFTLRQNGATELIWTGSNWYLFGDSDNFLTIT